MTEMLHTGKKVNNCIDTKFNVEANTSRSASAQRKLTVREILIYLYVFLYDSLFCPCLCISHDCVVRMKAKNTAIFGKISAFSC